MQLAIPKVANTKPSNHALHAAAKKRMLELAERMRQETTRRQSFEKLVENAKKLRRGGAPGGDVVPLGKRKEPEPVMPRSILRKPLAEQGPRAKPRIYGPRTEVFDIRDAIGVH